MAGAGAKPFVDAKIKQRKVLMFAKRRSPACSTAKEILNSFKMPPSTYEVVEIEARQDCTQIENYFQIICLTDTRADWDSFGNTYFITGQVPQLFVGGKYVGGEKEISRLHESGDLKKILSTSGAI